MDRAHGQGEPVLADPDTLVDARIRGRNRTYLLVIVAVCVVLGALGFAFARWLMSQPALPK